MFTSLVSVFFLALPHIAAASTTFEDRCLSFKPETYIDGATRNVLEFVAAGTTLKFPENDATCSRASQAVSTDLCRIGLSIKTSEMSNVTFEAWLPKEWSGRFLATGNGGIDGCMSNPG
jgi:feruloyl esterase